MKHKIIYIFARDFNQWTNQLIKELYATTIPKLWGRGLKDQMVHYTGRTSVWYRYEDDHNELRKYMAKKELTAEIFTEKVQKKFCRNVDQFRKLVTVDPEEIKDSQKHYMKIKNLFLKIYPFYPLCIFIPGPWREDFLAFHAEEGKEIIERLMESRHHSEGVLKINDNFMRAWLGPKLEAYHLPKEYLKLFTVEEMDTFVSEGKVPKKTELDTRAKGFFYTNNSIHPTTSLKKFLEENNLSLEETANEMITEVKGIVACLGEIVQGKVRLVLNSDEVRNFKQGEILITTMTAPDYLPAITRARAIITDEGGLTSHIAIVAREYNKPSIMGTKVATKVFKDGDLVEVDTIKGTARKL